jgi:hypothetical protein
MNKNNKVIYLKNKLNRLYKKLIVNNLKRVVFGLYFFFFKDLIFLTLNTLEKED